MGYTFKEYATQTFQAGILTVTMYYDSSITITHPAGIDFVELGEFIERIEASTGITEMPEVSLSVAEDYSTHTEGYWYKLFSESVDKDPVRFLFELNEGSGDVWLFDGYVDLITVRVNEEYISGSTHKRRVVSFTVYSRLKALEDATIASWVSDLNTHWVVDDLPYSKINATDITSTSSQNDGYEYQYQIAVRDADYEYAWGTAEIIVDGPDALDISNYIDLSWSTVGKILPASPVYAVYRVMNAGLSTNCGLIAETVATSISDNGLAVIQAGTTQVMRSSRQFVRLTDLFRSGLSAGLGVSSGESNVTLDTHDIKLKNGSDAYTPDASYVLFSKNYGSLAAPDWGRADYFKSTDPQYFGNRHTNILQLIGTLATQFGYYLRYTGNGGESIEMLTRGRAGSTITMDGDLVSSVATITSPVVAKTFRVFRVEDDTEEWISAANLNDYDMELGLYFGVYDADETLNDFEYLYERTTSGALESFDEMDGAQYYDYDTTAYVDAGSNFKMQETVGNYYFKLSYRKRRDYARRYTSIRSSGSHLGVKAAARTEISDGVTTRTFYANEVKKDINRNTLSVQWIQQ